jgi:DNA replication and repair protein RecF
MMADPLERPEEVSQSAGVTRLVLTQFRNHARLDLDLETLPVCLVGPNGAGKTNILEALTVLGPGRGLRGAELDEMARDGADGGPWAVSASLVSDGVESRVGSGLERTHDGGTRRVARLDGRSASPGDLARAVRLVWLTPAMDRLFAGPAGDRRRFLDRLASAAEPEHSNATSQYEKALRERSRLLEEPNPDKRWLSSLESEAALHGVALATARVETVNALQTVIDRRPDGAFPKADLALEGTVESELAQGLSFGAAEDAFAQRLHAARARDASAGRALDGPHRSDLLATHRDKGEPAGRCSTGEQKALIVGLILAHARRLASKGNAGGTRANPLVLIDEAGAHFDAVRRAALAEELLALPGQAWLTGTEASLFEAFGDRAALFEISAGSARRRR